MQGVSLCARCGIERSSAEPTPLRRTRRAVIFGLLSSGFLTKMALGTVALAAAGGIAVSLPVVEQAPIVVEASVPSEVPGAQVVNGPNDADETVRHAEEFAAEVRSWGQCVAEAASEHSGGAFDPVEACGPTPSPDDHGLGKAHAPGLNTIEIDEADGKVLPPTARTDEEKADNPNKPENSGKPAKDN
jgi:hypothetical protein